MVRLKVRGRLASARKSTQTVARIDVGRHASVFKPGRCAAPLKSVLQSYRCSMRFVGWTEIVSGSLSATRAARVGAKAADFPLSATPLTLPPRQTDSGSRPPKQARRFRPGDLLDWAPLASSAL
jgi:hypothetical protein